MTTQKRRYDPVTEQTPNNLIWGNQHLKKDKKMMMKMPIGSIITYTAKTRLDTKDNYRKTSDGQRDV